MLARRVRGKVEGELNKEFVGPPLLPLWSLSGLELRLALEVEGSPLIRLTSLAIRIPQALQRVRLSSPVRHCVDFVVRQSAHRRFLDFRVEANCPFFARTLVVGLSAMAAWNWFRGLLA